jgi:hypothetical protein
MAEEDAGTDDLDIDALVNGLVPEAPDAGTPDAGTPAKKEAAAPTIATSAADDPVLKRLHAEQAKKNSGKPVDDRHGYVHDWFQGAWRGVSGGNLLNPLINAITPERDYSADLPRADKMDKGAKAAEVHGNSVTDSTRDKWYNDAVARHPTSTAIGHGMGTGVLTTAAGGILGKVAPGVIKAATPYVEQLLKTGGPALAAALGVGASHVVNTLDDTTEKEGSPVERVKQVVADQEEHPGSTLLAAGLPVALAGVGKHVLKPVGAAAKKWANTQLGRVVAGQGEGSVRLQEREGAQGFTKLGDEARNLLELTKREGVRRFWPPQFNTLSENANKAVRTSGREIGQLDRAIQQMPTGQMRTLPSGHQVPELVYDVRVPTRGIKREIAGNVEKLRQGNEPVAAARVAGMLSKLRPRQGPGYRQPLKLRNQGKLQLNTRAGQPAVPGPTPSSAPPPINTQNMPIVPPAPGGTVNPVLQTSPHMPVAPAPTPPPYRAPNPPMQAVIPPSHVGTPPAPPPPMGPIRAQTRIPPLTQLPSATPSPFPHTGKIPYSHFQVPPRPALAPHAGPGARPQIAQPNDMLGIMRSPMRSPFAGALPPPTLVTPPGAPIRSLPSTAPTPPTPGLPNLRPQPGPQASVQSPVIPPAKPTPKRLPIMGSLPGPGIAQPPAGVPGTMMPPLPHLFPQKGPGLPSQLPLIPPAPAKMPTPYDPGPKHLTYGQARRIQRTQGDIKRHRDALHNKPSNIVDEQGRGPIYHGISRANDQVLDDMVTKGVVPSSYRDRLMNANKRFTTAAEHRKTLARSAVKAHGGHPEAEKLQEKLTNQAFAHRIGQGLEIAGNRMADPSFAAGAGATVSNEEQIRHDNDKLKEEIQEELNGTNK